jgi:DsbC/DsbD-like thiol-disulfide interchange protein
LHCFFVLSTFAASNTFFEQFENALFYENIESDCVEQIHFAMANDPKPLSEKEHHMLTWEGATERLFEAAAITVEDQQEFFVSGDQEKDLDCARMHYEAMKKGRTIQNLLPGGREQKEIAERKRRVSGYADMEEPSQ